MRYDDIIVSISLATEYFEGSPISITAIFAIQKKLGMDGRRDRTAYRDATL